MTPGVSDANGNADLATFCGRWREELAQVEERVRSAAIDSGRDPDAAVEPLDTSRAVGVKGDEREYGYMILLRAITTPDFMTADWYRFEPDFLAHVSNRIVNEVSGVTRVLYDITQKPPATICYM